MSYKLFTTSLCAVLAGMSALAIVLPSYGKAEVVLSKPAAEREKIRLHCLSLIKEPVISGQQINETFAELKKINKFYAFVPCHEGLLPAPDFSQSDRDLMQEYFAAYKSWITTKSTRGPISENEFNDSFCADLAETQQRLLLVMRSTKSNETERLVSYIAGERYNPLRGPDSDEAQLIQKMFVRALNRLPSAPGNYFLKQNSFGRASEGVSAIVQAAKASKEGDIIELRDSSVWGSPTALGSDIKVLVNLKNVKGGKGLDGRYGFAPPGVKLRVIKVFDLVNGKIVQMEEVD